MSTVEINQMDSENDNKTLDKKQIEEEEKEMMLKAENEKLDDSEDKKMEAEGTVRAALAGDVTEQGREVKPKYIPIGAIKMPGFFTRNSEKDKTKEDESTIEKDTEHEKTLEKTDEDINTKPQIGLLQAFAKLLQPKDNDRENDQSKRLGIFNVKYPKMFQKRNAAQEATLASMETLEDKFDTTNDGMENVKLDVADQEEGKVATRLPLKERVRQRKFVFLVSIVRSIEDKKMA
ncbi:hypothetical protein RR48_13703 [Papilio machaon]|uniref:Uncharacterized protein n=1 Tax=Papilio machaon TaxID=76193 RepID=A0A194RGY4_PAPMA|nr:hypothetical protein RR48_13703 [Papilio machaon]